MKRPLLIPFVSTTLSFCALLLTFSPPSRAGQGLIPLTGDYVYLSVPREEIVAAWGGTEEALILTAELAASKTTPVIRYLALPTSPTVERVSPEFLSRLGDLIARKAPRIGLMVDGRKTNKPAVAGTEPISEATIGPRSISVVKIESIDAFERVVKDLARREGVENPSPQIEKHRAVIADYLARGINYFVFDVVTIGEKKAAVDPLVIRFKTDSLFVPLGVSSRTSGVSTVDLFIVAPGSPKTGAVPYFFSPVAYRIPDGIDFAKFPDLLRKYNPLTYPRDHPVSFSLTMPERVALSSAVADVVSGWETKAGLAAFKYRGGLSSLTTDISLGRDGFDDADFETAVRAGEDAGAFAALAPDERFNILTVPGGWFYETGGSDSYTSRAAADGDPSTPYTLPPNGHWTIDLSKQRRIDGVEIVATVTKPDIVPSKNRLCLYASDTGEFSGEEKRVDTCVVRSFTSTVETDDPTRYAERIVLTDKKFSARFLKITYPYSESISSLYLFEVIPWGQKKD